MAISETRFFELLEQSQREHAAWLATHSADCLCNECTAGIGDTPDEPLFDFDEDVADPIMAEYLRTGILPG